MYILMILYGPWCVWDIFFCFFFKLIYFSLYQTFLDIFGSGALDANPTIVKLISSMMCTGFGEDLCMQGLTLLFGKMNGKSIDKVNVDDYLYL